MPKAIVVHETYNSGAVVKATHYPKWGKEEILWQGADPTPTSAGAGVSRLPVSTAIKTGRIKLYVNSPAVAGWNEIDAVGLEDDKGKIIWAQAATASSAFGSGGL